MHDVKQDVLDIASDVGQLSAELLVAEGDIDNLETNDTAQVEQINELESNIVQLSADLLVAEENIDALETNDALQEERIGVLESTVNNYLDLGIGFHVTLKSAPQNLSVGDAVKFDTIITNYGGGFNLTSSYFVAPRHGLYEFSSYFITGIRPVATNLCIMVNGDCISSELAMNNVRMQETGTCSAFVELQFRDVVKVVMHGDPHSYGGEVYNGGYTGFIGSLYKAL